MKKKIILLVLALATLAAAGVFISGVSAHRDEAKRRQAFDNLHATVVSRIAELAVLEYCYTDVMELNRSFMIGGNSTSLVRFSGKIKAGIGDVSLVHAEYNPKGNTIRLSLPKSSILDNTVDVSTVKIWDIKRNIFVPITTELKLQEVSAFRNRVENQLAASGFLDEACQRAGEVVSSMYAGFGASVILVQ